MKTLLEWLEDNRCNLKDGVYRTGWPGVILHDRNVINSDRVSHSTEEYVLKNGSISMIQETSQMKTLLEFMEENRSKLINGVYGVSGMGNLLFNGKQYDNPMGVGEIQQTNDEYEFFNGVIAKINEVEPPSFPKTASDYLKDGADLLSERGKQYDKSGQERSMEKIVRIFNDMTGQDLTTVQGWYFMQVLKDVRFFQNQIKAHADSLLDKINYAALMTEEALKDDE